MSILMPVQRGLVAWYDARAYWQHSGTHVTEIADLSGNLRSMRPMDLVDMWAETSQFLCHVQNNVFGNWPAFVGAPDATFGQGSYAARWDHNAEDDTELSICSLSRVLAPGPIGLNSTVGVSFGLYGADYYFGALASGFVSDSHWTGPFLLHPHGKSFDWNSQPLPSTRIILAGEKGGTTYMRQDGILQEEVPSVIGITGYNRLELGRGNPWTQIGIALFYNVKLTEEEAQQNEQFMDWTTSESIPYVFQPNKNPLP